MISMRPVFFWFATFATIITIMILLRGVLLPFVTGAALAYLLNPIAGRLERFGCNRMLATLAIVAVAAITIPTLGILTIPRLITEFSYFIEDLPSYVERLQILATNPSRPWLSTIVGEGLQHTRHSLDEFTAQMSAWFVMFLGSIWSGGEALIRVASLAVLVPVIACYLIYDWNRMIAAIDRWVPPAHRDTVCALAAEVDTTVRGFVRGRSLLCLVLAGCYASALLLLGLDHGALIGIGAGLLSFIPFLGALSGIAISLCIAFAQFWPNWTPVAVVLGVFLVGEFVADYALAPYLIGRFAHLHPVWMLFALLTFGYLFGFFGLLIAGPLASAIGVLMRFAMRQYYASPLYGRAPKVVSREIG